jgi:hypothetical protein
MGFYKNRPIWSFQSIPGVFEREFKVQDKPSETFAKSRSRFKSGRITVDSFNLV